MKVISTCVGEVWTTSPFAGVELLSRACADASGRARAIAATMAAIAIDRREAHRTSPIHLSRAAHGPITVAQHSAPRATCARPMSCRCRRPRRRRPSASHVAEPYDRRRGRPPLPVAGRAPPRRRGRDARWRLGGVAASRGARASARRRRAVAVGVISSSVDRSFSSSASFGEVAGGRLRLDVEREGALGGVAVVGRDVVPVDDVAAGGEVRTASATDELGASPASSRAPDVTDAPPSFSTVRP